MPIIRVIALENVILKLCHVWVVLGKVTDALMKVMALVSTNHGANAVVLVVVEIGIKIFLVLVREVAVGVVPITRTRVSIAVVTMSWSTVTLARV